MIFQKRQCRKDNANKYKTSCAELQDFREKEALQKWHF